MSTRSQVVRAAAASFASGVAAALLVNATVWIATGELPSLITSLIASQAVTWVWGGVQAYRLNAKWARVIAAYNLPAFGEGVDTPHRPPVADEDGEPA